MNEIELIRRHVAELRDLLNGFDFEVHTDEANPGLVQDADVALDNVEAAVESLVP